MSQPTVSTSTDRPATESLPPALPGQHSDFADADRHGHAIDQISQFEFDALSALEHGTPDQVAAAIRALASQAREQLVWARKVIQVRETQQIALREGLAAAQETLDNPAHCAPDLNGRDDREAALRDRVAQNIRDVMNSVTGPRTANGL